MSSKNTAGMVSADEWKRTSVHRASRYACHKCGDEFDSPDKVYEHIDGAHPAKRRVKRSERKGAR